LVKAVALESIIHLSLLEVEPPPGHRYPDLAMGWNGEQEHWNDVPMSRAFAASRRHFLGSLTAGAAACTAGLLRAEKAAEALPPVRAITRGPRFHWRGYYDKLLFDPTDRFVLANEVEFEGRSPTADDAIRLGMVDIEDGDRWIELGSTRAWNWQQGCMLQWIPRSESEVAWNDREDDRFVTRILDVKTRLTRTLPHPFYCIAPDGRTAFAPDFRRLNDTRPGYGYAGIGDPNRDTLAPENAGIWRLDLATGEQRLLFSFADAAAIPFHGRPEAAFTAESKHWFNHLLCNSDGTRLFFLHRWRKPGESSFNTRALTMGFDGRDVFVLDPWGGTSHFVWRDPRHVFAFAWHPSHQERFYVYEDRTANVAVVGPDVMTQNGHNTYVPGTEEQWVLNDTYPQPDTLQHVYLYHVPTGRKVPVASFPSPQQYRGEWRCDTHPCASRSGRKVVFDSPHRGGRQVYLADISGLVG
jgi:hypothetical protein